MDGLVPHYPGSLVTPDRHCNSPLEAAWPNR
jgi:hypothetical protein